MDGTDPGVHRPGRSTRTIQSQIQRVCECCSCKPHVVRLGCWFPKGTRCAGLKCTKSFIMKPAIVDAFAFPACKKRLDGWLAAVSSFYAFSNEHLGFFKTSKTVARREAFAREEDCETLQSLKAVGLKRWKKQLFLGKKAWGYLINLIKRNGVLPLLLYFFFSLLFLLPLLLPLSNILSKTEKFTVF